MLTKIKTSIYPFLPLLLAWGYLLLTFHIVRANRIATLPSKLDGQPIMSVSPNSLYFAALISEPRIMTHSITIGNAGSKSFTWTINTDVSTTLWLGLAISPTTGINTGTVDVSVNSALFTSTGLFTSTLWINAEPSTTLGSPFTLPVSLYVMDDWQRAFLPAIARNSPTPVITSPLLTTSLGLAFITSAETPASELRFQRALEAGATWDRWPFYWGLIETDDGVFNWSKQDTAVNADVEHGLQINAILMMPPAFHRKGPCDKLAAQLYSEPPRIGHASRQALAQAAQLAQTDSDCTTPANLDQPVFTDGTDIPAPGKNINPANPWARFVYTTVMRYKPGGALATQHSWSAEQGVRVWEIWNEPDYTWFWNGNASDYARTVAVGYLAIKHADPQAQVLLGGISDVNQRPDWLKDTLNVIVTYPHAQTDNWYFDSVAVHSYAWAWNTWHQLYRAQVQLNSHSITGKTLWVNESGVPVWDDPAVPITNPLSAYRATMLEQADYVIQSAIYALWMKAEAVFHFQLYDDCGNGPGMRDAFGLRRNDSAAPPGCYPSDEGARPSFVAYQVVARYLRNLTPKWRWRPADGGEEWIMFYDPIEGKRVLALWSRNYQTQTAILTATSTSAILIAPDGITQTITPVNGKYTLTLPAATNHNTPTSDGSAPIGGRTLLLFEANPSGTGGPKPAGLDRH